MSLMSLCHYSEINYFISWDQLSKKNICILAKLESTARRVLFLFVNVEINFSGFYKRAKA